MKINKRSAAIVAALAIATTGALTISQKADAATVATTHSGTYSSLYRANGSIISNRALGPNTPWRVGKIATINGETMYQVSTNEYLRAKDSTLNGQSSTQQSTKLVGHALSELSLYNDQTNSMASRSLAKGSDWQIGKVIINKLGQTFAQVSTHEYADATQLQFNPSAPTPTYVANFGMKNGSSTTNNSTDTNNSNSGSTTTDNNNSGQTTTTPDTNTNNGGSTSTDRPAGETDADASQSEYQQAILTDLNAARAQAGLNPLTMSSKLNAAAATRAQEISTDFSHTRPDGSTNASAVNDPAYIKGSTFGENIDAINDNGHMSASRLAQEHLNRYLGESGQGHYKNWQFANYKTVGIHVYHGTDGFYYVVEDMATVE